SDIRQTMCGCRYDVHCGIPYSGIALLARHVEMCATRKHDIVFGQNIRLAPAYPMWAPRPQSIPLQWQRRANTRSKRPSQRSLAVPHVWTKITTSIDTVTVASVHWSTSARAV